MAHVTPDGPVRFAGRKVTLQDVADRCGLSKSIVAQVLRNDARCRASDSTRAMINAAAEALNYQPDMQAKGIASRKSYLIGVLCNNSAVHNFPRLVSGIQAEAVARHYSVVYYAPSLNYESECESIEQAIRRQVDVLVIVPRDDGKTNADRLLNVHRHQMRVVQLQHCLHPEIPSITVDFRQLAYDATKHLIALGHRRILHINYGHCVKEWAVENDSNWQKLLGYRQAMEEAALKPMYRECPSVRPSSLESLNLRAMQMLEGEPTGIVAMNSSSAYGLVAGLQRGGVKVPGDVSVVGCEDDFVIPSCFSKQVCCARFDFEAMGRLATQVSFQLIDGGDARGIVLCPEFMQQETSGPVAD